MVLQTGPDKAPINKKLVDFHFPEVKKRKLDNGIILIVLEQPYLPRVYVRLGMGTGLKDEQASRAGLTQLVANTLKKGTRSRTYSQIINSIEQMGGELGSTVNEDFFFIYGDFISENLEEGFQILVDILLNAEFPDDELEKERLKIIADLENDKSSPDFLAHRRMQNALFSPHPYSIYKTVDSLQNISRADLHNFKSKYFSPDQTCLVFSGDVTMPHAEVLAEKYLANWPTVERKQTNNLPPSGPVKRTLYLVDRPGSQQSNILMGNILFPRNHPDFEKVLVMNKILGGGGSGRLFLNLREEKGYTYGAYSSLKTYKESGAILANAEVRNEVTGPAIEAFFDEFHRLQQELVGEKELGSAKRYISGIFPLQNETAASISSLVLKQQMYGLGENYWDHYLAEIKNVDRSEVREMASQFIQTELLSLVVVGDADSLYNELTKYGEVSIYDLEDKLIRA